MSEEVNPNQQSDPSNASPDQRLTEALEDLVSQASNRRSIPSEKFGSVTPQAAGPCPGMDSWVELACGSLPAEKKDALLAHAALCSACLVRMREAQHVLSSEASSEETAALQQLSSTTSQWQHRLAVELAHSSHGAKRARFWPSFVWQGAALAAVLVLALSVAVLWRRQNAPERLLAEAYTDARTFELRVPGAGFAPVAPPLHLRGESTGREPAPLLNARAQIERNLEKSPSDPHWLQLEARAEMLEEHYDSAIDILDRLVAAGPVTASLLLDDGTAYFMRGTATGSENDRATALDDLHRADELAPDNPVVLFNEALVMEDRGQLMNAVETWNRFLKFEHDPKWQAEGRSRLANLQDKLDRVKTHDSRLEQHLASPQSMRALAANPAALASIDEELSSTLLPRLLDAAFPLPVDRSRGSPCSDTCLAARSLLHALAASLLRNHQDPWLQQFFPSKSSPLPSDFHDASHALALAIDANTRGDYADAESGSLQSRDLFRKLGNTAGADRAEVERTYALQRSYTLGACHQALQALLAHIGEFHWIEAQAISLDASCDMDRGTASETNPLFDRALQLAQAHRYVLLELRAETLSSGIAVESGDTENAWRILVDVLRRFYQGDYPPLRAATALAGLSIVEDSTPRQALDLLENRETVILFSLSPNRPMLTEQRAALVRAAIREGSLQEAREQLALVRKETVLAPDQKGPLGVQAETETMLASLYLDRGDLRQSSELLDAARNHMVGEDNHFQLRNYAAVRGDLELAEGHADLAESTLRNAILREELEGAGAGEQNVTYARQNRDLYAALAGVWLAESRPGIDILALWERYRLRILGLPVPACSGGRLDCLKTRVEGALAAPPFQNGHSTLIGQIVRRNRVLLYHADAREVFWSEVPVQETTLTAYAASLVRVVSSPTTSPASIDQASRRIGDLLLQKLDPARVSATVIIETDPILGNLPWSAVETAEGPIGLHYGLEEVPSLLLQSHTPAALRGSRQESRPLIVGASIAGGANSLLPEALNEARMVASLSANPDLLLAREATAPHVLADWASAPIIHFAGHATEFEGATRLLLAPSDTPGDRPYLDGSLLRRDPPRSAQLIVFSACASGKREEGWNHGIGDIVDTLASLGVPQVVATRWRIDSASAVPMMTAFYGGLAKGLSVPQALTAARISLARDARYRHPYYWAAYYDSGVGSTDLREVLHGTN